MESLKKQHITPLRQTLLYVAYTVILLSEPTLAQADDPDHWDTCRALVEAIRNGSTTHDGITKDNIGKLLYDGPVRGLVSSYPRNQLLLVTYEGLSRPPPCMWFRASILAIYVRILLTTPHRHQDATDFAENQQ